MAHLLPEHGRVIEPGEMHVCLRRRRRHFSTATAPAPTSSPVAGPQPTPPPPPNLTRPGPTRRPARPPPPPLNLVLADHPSLLRTPRAGRWEREAV
jgi:hypothetical protein